MKKLDAQAAVILYRNWLGASLRKLADRHWQGQALSSYPLPSTNLSNKAVECISATLGSERLISTLRVSKWVLFRGDHERAARFAREMLL